MKAMAGVGRRFGGTTTGRIALAASVGLALAAAGCLPGLGGGSRAKVPLHGKVLMIAPFRMPGATYFKSEVGAEFSQQIASVVLGDLPRATLITIDDVPPELLERKMVDGRPVQLLPSEVAAAMGARYVLIGEIKTLRGKPPGSYGILQGAMTLSARVVDLEERKIVWRTATKRKTYYYPSRLAGTEDIPAPDKSEGQVIRKVMYRAALDIATVFTGRDHLKEMEDKESR